MGSYPETSTDPENVPRGGGGGWWRGGFYREGENVFAQTLSEQVPIKNFPQLPPPVTASNT